jgi:hypothetical protein
MNNQWCCIRFLYICEVQHSLGLLEKYYNIHIIRETLTGLYLQFYHFQRIQLQLCGPSDNVKRPVDSSLKNVQ